jgi:hypothetical protein
MVFLLWMCFLDRDDLFSQMNLDRKLADVESRKEYYLREIQKLKAGISDLNTKPYALEKFAREKYYMKKDNEEIFVMIEKSKTPPKDSLFSKIHSIFSKPIPEKAKPKEPLVK